MRSATRFSMLILLSLGVWLGAGWSAATVQKTDKLPPDRVKRVRQM